MTSLRQGWLAARREMRERARTRAFRVSTAIMILVAAAVIVAPALLGGGDNVKDVGLAGTIPGELPAAIRVQADSVSMEARIHRFDSPAAGEEAVRQGEVDVLVVDAQRLEWRGSTDGQLLAVVSGAIQLVAVRERAAAAGISPDELLAVVEPVPVHNVKIGLTAGRTVDDELAAVLMSALLLIAISTYGNMVLTGVAEEKSSRVVEVLLARMPARALLAGKTIGIGLLGLAQLAAMALVALACRVLVDSVDMPAIGAVVLTWVVVWFVLGYALYAMAYGTFGSLASRSGDPQSVAGPVIIVLIASYLASSAAIGQDPTSRASQFVSLLPVSAPFAMPARIALGATAWWEPPLAVMLSLATIVGLVEIGGRLYAGAILHSGATLKLREAWRGMTSTDLAQGDGAKRVPGWRQKPNGLASLHRHRPALR